MSARSERVETVRATFAVMRAKMNGKLTNEFRAARLAESQGTDNSAGPLWLEECTLPQRRSNADEASRWNKTLVDPAVVHTIRSKRSLGLSPDPLFDNLWLVFKSIQQCGEAVARRGRALTASELAEKRQHRINKVATRDALYREQTVQQAAMDYEAALEQQHAVELFGERHCLGSTPPLDDMPPRAGDVGSMADQAWAKFLARERAIQQHRLAVWLKKHNGLVCLDHKAFSGVILPADLLAALRQDSVAISVTEFCDLWFLICDQAAELRSNTHCKLAPNSHADPIQLEMAKAACIVETHPQFDRYRLSFQDFFNWQKAHHPDLCNRERKFVLVKLVGASIFHKEFRFWLPMVSVLDNLRTLRGAATGNHDTTNPARLDGFNYCVHSCRHACAQQIKPLCCNDGDSDS